jgi:hypothetical protein
MKAVYLISSAVSLLNAVSLAVLQAWWLSLLSLVLALILANLSRRIPFSYLINISLGICLSAMIIVSPVTLNQISTGMREIGNEALQYGPENLDYVTRFGLWWSALWLSIGGVAFGAPHAVAEQVMMFWPGDENRVWNSDFPTKSKKVRRFIERAKKEAANKNATFKTDLIWKSYCQDNCDVGLALNGGDLTVVISNKGERCVAVARVSVWYKPQYRTSTILGYGKYRLSVDQAAYWALQELGWLHPYTLRYKWEC